MENMGELSLLINKLQIQCTDNVSSEQKGKRIILSNQLPHLIPLL